MPALLVPILAQAVALQMGDRTELRVVRDEIRRDVEAETRPRVHLGLTWPRASLGVGYAPSLRFAPIDSPSLRERQFGLVPDDRFSALHAVDGQAGVTFGSERTTLTLSQTASWALRNFHQEAVSGGAPSSVPATPVVPTPGVPSSTEVTRASSRDVNWGAARSGIELAHGISRNHMFRTGLSYDASGGLGTTARRFYPFVHGPEAYSSVHSLLSRRTQLTSAVNASYNFSQVAEDTPPTEEARFLSTRSWMVEGTETISYQISRNLKGDVGGGVAYARNEEAGEPEVGAVLPTGSVGLEHEANVAKGQLSTRISSELSPTLDSTSGTIDWWYRSEVSIGWRGSRWAFLLTSAGELTVQPQGETPGETDTRTLSGSASISYDLRHGFAAELGTRAIWQQVDGRYTILPSLIGFAALTWATEQRLD